MTRAEQQWLSRFRKPAFETRGMQIGMARWHFCWLPTPLWKCDQHWERTGEVAWLEWVEQFTTVWLVTFYRKAERE